MMNYPPSSPPSVGFAPSQRNYGYTPGQPGYPPGPPGYPPGQPGYPPGPPGYPPGQPGYSHGHSGYPPGQSGYPPGYPPGAPPEPYPNSGYPSGPVISAQPVAHHGDRPLSGWMNIPQSVINCPPGLEYLSMIDQLLVHQKVELLEAFTGFETTNKFSIKNSLGQKIYFAGEESDCCSRNCCGPQRPFQMRIIDNTGNHVMQLHRPLACDSCCFPCCLQSLEVSAPPGNVIGSIEQEWSICCPSFSIKDANKETVLKIDGPFCRMSICGNVEFKVMSLDGNTQVGKISKQWSGLIREAFTDADIFGISFPMDLDVRMKAVLLGACFLIDAMFFEKSQNREEDRPTML